MISAAARAALAGRDTPEIFAELAILESDAWSAPIHVVNVAEEGFSVVSAGRTFHAYPFALTWPARDPNQPFGGAKFMINNVVARDGTDEPLVLYQLRTIPNRARVKFEVIRLSAPNVIEAQTTRLRLTGCSYSETTITGNLELPDFTTRRAGQRFTPDQYPNLRPG